MVLFKAPLLALNRTVNCRLITAVFLLFLLLAPASLFAQMDSTGSNQRRSSKLFKDRVLLGGNVGLQFGSITIIDVSPLIGYKVTERITVGLGSTYLYFEDRVIRYNTTIYGGRTFGRYFFTPNIFGHAEYEVLNGEWFFDEPRFNVTSILVGAGYNYEIGNNIYTSLLLLFNINDSSFSPYSNPLFRAGIAFGI